MLFDSWADLPLSQTLPLRATWSAVLLSGVLLTCIPRSHDGLAWMVGAAGCVGAWVMARITLMDTNTLRHVPGLITLFIAAVGMAPTIRSAAYVIALLVVVPTITLLAGGMEPVRVLEADAFLIMAALMCALVCHLLEQGQLRAFLAERALERRASTDALTGLANREHFFRRAEGELARRTRSGAALAVLMMDVDHFKHVNDTWGHDAGDRVLTAVAEQLRPHARETDVLARTGGEEFVLLAVGATLGDAVEIGERIRAAVGALRVSADPGAIPVTISVGCTTVAPDDTAIDPALKRADHALYQAKRQGRNRVMAAPTPPLEGTEVRGAALEEGGHRFL
ncbi:MAG: GGDEF domain-containing protein [Magnetospirillum sp.]|nr:GGDEF domain-containing protein [Magnetospirillum sp.]